ncbi:hypothetical protein VitviT2T_004168 [Vitis vinifera]|uniref:Retrovirus-related Pol polyprotein from transposon TNT 1-94 n=1 Tax=Vitis vinifera TaxID=29760 RepID=A0ABY9BNN8_VITVI|nr:hypothetical protein VitviT2T_004168 [Vitis vinifera]
MISLKYQDGTPMTDHLNTFQGMINQLVGMNIQFEEEVQGLWLLGTLSDSWETFRTSLSISAPYGTMNMDLVKSCVLNEEMRRKSQGPLSQSDVLVTEKRGRSKSRGPKNRDRSKSKTNKFVNVECHYCHLKEHIKKYCRQLKRDMKQGKVKNKKNDNSGEDDRVATTISDFLIVYDGDVVNFSCQETSWVIDSGASIHATPWKDFFTSYTSSDFGSVRMGNDGSAKAIGKLDNEGFCNTFRDSQWKLTKGSMVIAKGKKCSSLYLMQARVIDSSINAVDDDSTKGSLKRCAHCVAGKQTRVAFKTHHHTRKPDRIRSDNEISYDHLHVFGCKAFVHIPKNEKSKLDAKTRPCVFIGYGHDELGYRFYDPV